MNYEDTVTDLESTARRLIEACGLSLGAGLPRIPSHRAPDSHRQRDAGSPAGLSAVGGALEELRAGAGRALRRACRAEDEHVAGRSEVAMFSTAMRGRQ